AVEVNRISGLQSYRRIQSRVEVHFSLEHEGVFLARMPDELAEFLESARMQFGNDRDDFLVQQVPGREQMRVVLGLDRLAFPGTDDAATTIRGRLRILAIRSTK